MPPPSINRRDALCCGAATLGLFSSLLADDATAHRALPSISRDLEDAAFDGIDATQLWDVHAHLLGTGDSGSGCWVHPHLDSWWHPLEVVRKRVILRGAGVNAASSRVDRDYVQRLATLAMDFPDGARLLLFAFDHAHDEQGQPQTAQTTFHVPDAWAAHVAATHAERFGWVASIHPYRDDALPRLTQAIAHGALAVKWLPSAMNIDLRDRRCVPFYEAMVRAGVLEAAEVDALEALRVHNPLLFDVVLKRKARWRGARLASTVFHTRRHFTGTAA